MGNRATVIFTDPKRRRFSPAVYLHWNGGPESIYGFLEELDRRECRADQDYECARFIQIVGEFFGNTYDPTDKFDAFGCLNLSLGVSNGPKSDSLSDLGKVETDHGDNGFYLVNRTGEGPPMRRFRASYGLGGGYSLQEVPPDEVVAERAEAEKSDYLPEFREFFQKLYPKPVEEAVDA